MTMQFRKFGRLDWNASVLGFGCMRLPTVDGNPHGPNINEAEAVRMIRHALDRGVNYFDTAYVYHEGNSETVLGKALRGHRDRVKIATKSPVWLIQKEADFDRILNEQLRKLQTDHIDFYLLHALDESRGSEIVPKYELLEKAGGRDSRRTHPPPGFLVPRQLRELPGHPQRLRPVDVLPDSVQLHGHGKPGGHQGIEAGRRQRSGGRGHGTAAGRQAGQSAGVHCAR